MSKFILQFAVICILVNYSISAQKSIDHSLPEGKSYSFGKEFSGSNDSFTFGIIADRFGGNTIVGWTYFEQAIRDMNRLKPEFVLMPGDLIDGYMNREGVDGVKTDFNEQYDQFESFANKLKMPLYAVAGNHDLPNKKMIAPYVERYGNLYYSFNFRNVHFLAICTEAEPEDNHKQSHLTDQQVAWAINDLKINNNVRHTVVFMHVPVWNYKNSKSYKQWIQIEEALKDRKYTVIAAHTHKLASSQRNENNYYIMASSGGGIPKPHSFYYGNAMHTALAKIEGDSLNLTILELGSTHSMDQLSINGKPINVVKNIRSLHSTSNGYEAEICASVTNHQSSNIYAEISLSGLAPNGWNSSIGGKIAKILSPGETILFNTVFTIKDLTTSSPPVINIKANDKGLILSDYKKEIPLFKDDDYKNIKNWYCSAPFNALPMKYSKPPYAVKNAFPAMFKNFGPENNKLNSKNISKDSIKWKQIELNNENRIDFGKTYRKLNNSIGYAISFINSPNERLVYIRFKPNDFGRIFLNGKAVGKELFSIGDGLETFPVWLKSGKNTILVKIANMSGNWNFEFKISDQNNVLNVN